MVTALPTPAQVSSTVLEKTFAGSAILNNSNLAPFTGSSELRKYTFNGSDAEFHDGSDDAEKKVSNDQVGTAIIETKTLYKIYEFTDTEYEDDRVVRNAIENQTAPIFYRTLDKVAAAGQTLVPSSTFAGYTVPSVEVGGTTASWLNAVAAVRNKGYNPDFAILDISFIEPLREAFVEGTNTNGLGVDIADGKVVAGVRVYFRPLGAQLGVIGDSSQAVVAYNNEISVDSFSPKTDYTLAKKDRNAVKGSWRVGYGVGDQDAFQPVTLATAGE